MTEEIKDDNKSIEGDNKPIETPEAPLPNLPEEPKQPTEPQDPEYDKWAKETGSLQNAYHRVKGSAAEVDKWRKEAETLAKVKAEHDQLTQELRLAAERDPELLVRIQKALVNEPVADNKETVELPAEDRKLLDNLRAKETYEAMETIKKFRTSFKDYVQTEEQWDAIREHAKRLDGTRNINGVPYTLETALQAAIRAEMPAVVSDRAALEAYASSVNRDSAAEPGDTASGRASDINLDPEEEAWIKRFSKYGVTREGYLRRKAQ